MAEDHVEPSLPDGERSTAPQTPYELGDVATGLVVLAVGLVLTFGIAVALA